MSTSSPRTTLRSMTTPSSGATTSSFAHCWTDLLAVGRLFADQAVGLGPHLVDVLLGHPPALQASAGPRETAIRSASTFRWVSRRVRRERPPRPRPWQAAQTVSHPRAVATRRRSARSSSRPGPGSRSPPSTWPLRTCWPKAIGCDPLPALAQLDHLAGKPRVDVRQAIGVQDQRARKLQRGRARSMVAPARSAPPTAWKRPQASVSCVLLPGGQLRR